MYSYLADVRNRYGIVPISQPRGLPPDVSKSVLQEWAKDLFHSATYLNVDEIQTNLILSREYHEDLEELKASRAERIVFWFDN